jgi:hypothetical protein
MAAYLRVVSPPSNPPGPDQGDRVPSEVGPLLLLPDVKSHFPAAIASQAEAIIGAIRFACNVHRAIPGIPGTPYSSGEFRGCLRAVTLKAAYGQPQEKVLDVLSAILALPGLGVTDASLAGRAVSLSRNSGREFADAYIAASAEEAGADAVATFNRKHFEKLGAALHGF